MNSSVVLEIYKEAAFFADNIESLAGKLGHSSKRDTKSAYQLLASNPKALKKSKANRLHAEKVARKSPVQD